MGVDLWQRGDQSGNSSEATLRNAVAEGVTDRIELHTGDMMALPFAGDCFDVVLSSIAIHNVKSRASRDEVIAEAVRVLRPRGRLLIADIRCTGEYFRKFQTLGMTDISRRDLGWRMWWSGPWMAPRLVKAVKPGVNPQT